MRYVIGFLLMITCNSSGAQINGSTTAKTTTVNDTLRQNILAAANSFLKLVENPKKGVHFFMNDLRETNDMGHPVYTAPFPIAGFTASVRKINTIRESGQTRWTWSAKFIEMSGNQKRQKLDTLRDQLNRILKVFDNRTKAVTKDKAERVAF